MSLLTKISGLLGYGPTPSLLPVTIKEKPLVPNGFPSIRRSTRVYEAAQSTEQMADWMAFGTSGSYETLNAFRLLCYRARALEENDPYAEAFLRDLENNVIGNNGVRLSAKVKNQKGPNLNDKLNTQIQDAWKDFRKRGNYDVTGQFSGNFADKLCLRRMAVDGGVLLRLYRNYPNKYGLAVQLIEVDSLSIWLNKFLENGNRITMGVETDSFGKPVAYWLDKYAEADLMATQTIGGRIRVPASEIIHCWLPKRITSVRGVSFFANVLIKMRMMNKFSEAVVIGKRVTAAKGGFYEHAPNSEHIQGQDQLPTGELVNELSPGSIEDLPFGVTYKPNDPGKSEDGYAEFRKSMLREIASGLGAQYNALSQDLESVNLSTAKFGRSEVINFWQALQTFYVETVLTPLFNAFSEMAALKGALNIPFESLDTVQSQMVWRPRGWPAIDLQKEIQGSTGAVSFGLSTHARELAETGQDLEETFQELQAEKELMLKYGLVFVDPMGRSPFVGTEEDPDAGPGKSGDVADTSTPPAKPSKPVATKPVAKVKPSVPVK